MKTRLSILAAVLLLVAASVLVTRALAQRENETAAAAGTGAAVPAAAEQWEYLVVAGSNVNFRGTGNPSMRKEPDAGWARESFVLEQNLDKLGAKGWELVSVEGGAGDPTFFFKRRK